MKEIKMQINRLFLGLQAAQANITHVVLLILSKHLHRPTCANRQVPLVVFIAIVVFVNINILFATTRTSAISGNFTATSTWIGGVVPITSDTVVIASGDTVKFKGLTLHHLIINAGGVLENDSTLTITEAGSGTLFTINGVYTGTGDTWITLSTATSSNNRLNGSGNFSASGGFYYTGTNTACQIDTSANLTFDMGATVRFITGGLSYLNTMYCYGKVTFITGDLDVGWSGATTLIIENTGQIILTAGSNLNISANSTVKNNGTVTVASDVTAGNSFSTWYNYVNSTVNVAGAFLYNQMFGYNGKLYANYSGNTVNYNGTGNQKVIKPYSPGPITSTRYYWNLKCSNNGKKTLAYNITINGDLTIQDAAQLDDSTNYSINLKGNWINTSSIADPFLEQAGTVTCSGTAAQSITASAVSGGETFYNLTINNSSTSGDTLKSPVTVSNALTLTAGKVFTSDTNILTLNNNATSTSGSSASFIEGPMKKIGNTAFVFPLGNLTTWARLGISAPATATTEYTAQYFHAAYGNGLVPGDLSTNGSLHHVSSLEYWTLAQGVNTDNVQITLYWEDASVSEITDCTDLSIGHFTGGTWLEEAATSNGGSICSGTGSGSITTNAVVTSYSPFTFAAKNGWTINPLPIELLNFTATVNGDDVELFWTTATETNNDYFTVERGTLSVLRTSPFIRDSGVEDTLGINFIPIGTVKGAGNSNILLNYHLIDESPLSGVYPDKGGREGPGVRYYRLKQTDYDGKSSYSSIISIRLQNIGAFTIFPNPAKDWVTMNIPGDKDEALIISIIDKLGRTAITKAENIKEGQNSFNMDVSGLSNGAYLLQIVTASGKKEQKQFAICN